MGSLQVLGIDDFQKSALTYKKELLMMPILALGDTLKHMSLRPGVRYGERVGDAYVDAQFAPYVANKITEANLQVNYRELNTYFGAVNKDFDPNTAISTILGHMASQGMGEGLKTTETAKKVLTLIARSLGENLNAVIWNATRNASGTTSKDLFDGFDTILQKEITAEKVSTTKGNLVELDAAITKANACDVLKSIVFNLDPVLREQNLKLYCSYAVADAYNESYLLTHGATPYNTQYNKTFIEGSNNKIELVPLANKADSNFMQLTSASNLLIGIDQMGDIESVQVNKYKPDTLTYEARMFFGAQYESIDKRVFKAIKLYTPPTSGTGSGS